MRIAVFGVGGVGGVFGACPKTGPASGSAVSRATAANAANGASDGLLCFMVKSPVGERRQTALRTTRPPLTTAATGFTP